ncbi:MAG: response regulator [Flavobacterium sp.]|nr:response regulator [Flavobacterium sp.]
MKKMMIVDDDPRNIFALKAVLKVRSFECITCNSTTEALKVLKTEQPVDAVLLDMMMPELDGYEAIPLIKAIPHRKIPVIAVTAQAMNGDRERCLRAGADEYIAKPIDIDKLLLVLNKLL